MSELGNNLDGIRAYFCARSWTPFRLPVFILGMVLAAKRQRALRNGDTMSAEYVKVRSIRARGVWQSFAPPLNAALPSLQMISLQPPPPPPTKAVFFVSVVFFLKF